MNEARSIRVIVDPTGFQDTQVYAQWGRSGLMIRQENLYKRTVHVDPLAPI